MGKKATVAAPSNPAVLLVDDDPSSLNSLGDLFEDDPVRILRAQSGLHALDLLRVEKVGVVVSDYWMRGMDGIQLLREIARLYPSVRRVLLTGLPDSDLVMEAREHKVLTKDMGAGLIRRVILREARRSA